MLPPVAVPVPVVVRSVGVWAALAGVVEGVGLAEGVAFIALLVVALSPGRVVFTPPGTGTGPPSLWLIVSLDLLFPRIAAADDDAGEACFVGDIVIELPLTATRPPMPAGRMFSFGFDSADETTIVE